MSTRGSGGGGVGGLSSNNRPGVRDYGSISAVAPATSSSSSSIPDVNFAGFSPTEFISLSDNIGQNIQSVVSSWHQLEKAIKMIGTQKDSQAMRNKLHNIQTIANGKITETSKDLQRLRFVVRGGDKQQKLQVEKLTTDFRDVVAKYSKCQQIVASKMKMTALPNIIQMQQQLQEEDELNNQDEDERYRLIQEQKRLERDLKMEKSLLKEREMRVKQIEADVLDVNVIMRDLNNIVNYQGETIDTIENGISSVANEVEQGQSELAKASQHQAKYRRKVVILLIIAVIVGIIVAGIIVSQLKS